MKKSKAAVFPVIAFISLFFSGAASAGGYFDANSKYDYSGWACEPTTPAFQGWVHLWRDDGKFLGALDASGMREPAVGDECGGISAHGFNATISFPFEYLDNQVHYVHAYFIRQDNTTFELQNSPKMVTFDGGAVTPPPPPTTGGCGAGYPGNGWTLTRDWGTCVYGQTTSTFRTYTYYLDMPVGSELVSCSWSTRSNWSVIRSGTSTNCAGASFNGFGSYQLVKRMS